MSLQRCTCQVLIPIIVLVARSIFKFTAKVEAKVVVPAYIPDVIKEDPDDNHILACALAGNANLIVSRDLDLLRLKTYGTIGIISPIDFLHTLEGFKKAA